VAPRVLIVDDDRTFIEAASSLLERDGIDVAGAATTVAEALDQADRLAPDALLVDVNLGDESGFDLVRQLASAHEPANMILISTNDATDLAELAAESPVLGFLSKSDLSAAAICDFLEDRTHGHGCRHEALVYSNADDLVAGAAPFLREGLAADDVALAVLRESRSELLREALDDDASRIEFVDAVGWYQSPRHALERYKRYIHHHLAQGADRVRVVAEVIWPAAPPVDWKRYESRISFDLAPVPVSFICAYDRRELSEDIVEAAERTHPLLRSRGGPRPSPGYAESAAFLRELG
jgi:CheY-like chemotaxis protein